MKQQVHKLLRTALVMLLFLQFSAVAFANTNQNMKTTPMVFDSNQSYNIAKTFRLSPDDEKIDPEDDSNDLTGRLTAPGILKKLNGNFHLDILAEGNAKKIKMDRGNKKETTTTQGKGSAPGLLKKNESSNKPPQNNGLGRGNSKWKTQGSSDWSGELLENIEPLVPDEKLLRDFGVIEAEVAIFENAYPSVLPLYPTYITSDFGKRRDPKGRGMDNHEGVDLKADYQEIWATGSGIVTHAGYLDSYGYLVEIDHGYGIVTRYAHNSKLLVSQGQTVDRYHVIAISGNSGNSTGPHLHYEIEVDGANQNPISVIYDR